jgi:hypothetical protein
MKQHSIKGSGIEQSGRILGAQAQTTPMIKDS